MTRSRRTPPLFKQVCALALVLLATSTPGRAGGPEYVAGTSFFNTSMTGQPLTWPQGLLVYYTDQGDLSPVLPQAAANALVADAFSQWTAVPTAAIAAVSGGELVEDVNGSNVTRNADNTISMPADIQPSATAAPIAIVYDSDGAVTEALLGSGAGDPSQCFFNATFGGPDNFTPSANFDHALVVINGQCAQTSPQLVDVEYRLVRTLGNVIGLDWSQLNLNVLTGKPHPTSDDYAGFPVMHYIDPFNCVPITRCYANPYRLSMDDTAVLSRLYPVTAQNQSNFSGKRPLSSATASIFGSVWFTDPSGNPTQPMQGVNVVARWIDPSTGLPSGRYAASSVSGYLFAGNAGNAISGFTDPLGTLYSEYGSTDPALEGLFELEGLQIPDGTGVAQYQLSVEPLDTTWSEGVAPYGPYQVTPSGPIPPPILVNVTLGVETEQHILMAGSAQPIPQWATSETWAAPAPIPPAGDWMGSIYGYGNVSYFSLPAQANRTLSISVTALDESGNATVSKGQPLIGLWDHTDPQGSVPGAFTTSPFNAPSFGTTRLDGQILNASTFIAGIADLRGDGRPDYHYHAHVLYGDSASPTRTSASGGSVTVHGIGFAPGLTVSVGHSLATPLAVYADQMLLDLPTLIDGPQDITITDPVTGSFSTMSAVITTGASPTDNLVLIRGSNPATPVGTQTPNPVMVRAVAVDGVTPVAGATLGWTTSKSAALSACSGASACLAITDANGMASTWVTPATSGSVTITATLAPAVYNPPKTVGATVVGSASASDIGVVPTFVWIAQGSTVAFPIAARVLSNGTPVSGAPVNFIVAQGTGSLSVSSAQTDSNGNASVSLSVANFSNIAQVSVCVGPSNSPCKTVYANPVVASALRLQPVSGTVQAITLDQSFQPLAVQVADSSSPPNPVLGAAVAFQQVVMRPSGELPAFTPPSSASAQVPVILSVTQSTVVSDVNGMAALVPSLGTFTGNLQVDVSATAGASGLNYLLLAVPPASPGGMALSGLKKPVSPRLMY